MRYRAGVYEIIHLSNDISLTLFHGSLLSAIHNMIVHIIISFQTVLWCLLFYLNKFDRLKWGMEYLTSLPNKKSPFGKLIVLSQRLFILPAVGTDSWERNTQDLFWRRGSHPLKTSLNCNSQQPPNAIITF